MIFITHEDGAMFSESLDVLTQFFRFVPTKTRRIEIFRCLNIGRVKVMQGAWELKSQFPIVCIEEFCVIKHRFEGSERVWIVAGLIG